MAIGVAKNVMAKKKKKSLKINNPDRYQIKIYTQKYSQRKKNRKTKETEIKMSSKKVISVRDIQTNKQVALKTFSKRFNVSESELNFLRSDNKKGDITDSFKQLNKDRNYDMYINSNDIKDLSIYKAILYNGKKISLNNATKKIYEFTELIGEVFPDWWSYFIRVEVRDGYANFAILKTILNEEPEGVVVTDERGNYIMLKS